MKYRHIIFISVFLVVCLLPSVGFLLFPTTRTTENRPMADPPRLTDADGAPNTRFFDDFETWFNERMGLRNELVAADAKIQSGVFAESNVSGVVRGTDGWLYYSSTLEDYQGLSPLSDRDLFCLARNFSAVQDYLDHRGVSFVLTVPPNKNTLYGEHMPYYDSVVVTRDHSAVRLGPLLEAQGINYVNLFDLFSSREDVLYLQRDSHWNNDGARLAYDAVMDAAEMAHEDYADARAAAVQSRDGDLNRMLYSFYGPEEENAAYDLPGAWTYEGEDADVEDGWIVTHCADAGGTLLMFRDSFANTLIPFLSEEFGTACYSKGLPNALERYLETWDPDCVVIEKVERNISDYLTDPPILTPVETEAPRDITIARTDSTVSAAISENDVNYLAFSGTVDPLRVTEDTEILVSVNDRTYPAYLTGGNSFLLYLKASEIPGSTAAVRVYAVSAEGATLALYEEVSLPG
ncbi:MAG: hypothetical protein IKH56_08490 [Oscillospiraceae bacterium]|nr:hypothetical protein [Oscillospiraceae bacterium]